MDDTPKPPPERPQADGPDSDTGKGSAASNGKDGPDSDAGKGVPSSIGTASPGGPPSKDAKASTERLSPSDLAPLALLLVVQQILFWTIVLSNNPQVSVTFDCVAGAMGLEILRGFTFSPLDTYDGVLGGIFVGALFGSPLFATFGFSGFTLKLAASAFILATLSACWIFLRRSLGPLAAFLGTATLAFPPPIHFQASAILGNWHYTEILFDLLCALLLYSLVWGGRGRDSRLALGGGVLVGLTLFNSFGSFIFLSAYAAIGWATLRGRMALKALALLGLGTIAGSSPFWWKVLIHAPFGMATGQKVPVPEEMTNLSISWNKAMEMFVDGGFAYGLHVQDFLDIPRGSALSWGLAHTMTAALFLGWILLLVRTAPSLKALALGALPGRSPADPAQLSPAVIPAAMGLVYLAAFYLSDMSLELLPWYLTNPRELGHATLTPWVFVLGLSGAVAAASFIQEARGRPVPPGLWSYGGGNTTATGRPTAETADARSPATALAALSALLLLALLLANLTALLGAVRPWGRLQGMESAFRGQCFDVHGFYMVPKLGGDLDHAGTLCNRYGSKAAQECRRGAAWAAGFLQANSEDEGGPPMGPACDSLVPPWRRECFRGLGWALQSMGQGGIVANAPEVEACDSLPNKADQAACWRGVGFPLGDHLHPSPERLMRALQDFPSSRRQDIARGAATHIGRSYSSLRFMQRLCSQWDPDLRDACGSGVEDSLSFRTDAAAVRGR